jgi:lipoprotein-releasing system ATP-binding protein
VFQDHCLLPQCSVIENVLTPTMVAASANGEPTRRATELLKQVGLASAWTIDRRNSRAVRNNAPRSHAR